MNTVLVITGVGIAAAVVALVTSWSRGGDARRPGRRQQSMDRGTPAWLRTGFATLKSPPLTMCGTRC